MASLKEIQTNENKMTIYKNITSVRNVTWDNKVWVLQKMATEKKLEARKWGDYDI